MPADLDKERNDAVTSGWLAMSTTVRVPADHAREPNEEVSRGRFADVAGTALVATAGGVVAGIGTWAMLRDTISYAPTAGVVFGAGAGVLIFAAAVLMWVTGCRRRRRAMRREPAERLR